MWCETNGVIAGFEVENERVFASHFADEFLRVADRVSVVHRGVVDVHVCDTWASVLLAGLIFDEGRGGDDFLAWFGAAIEARFEADVHVVLE